MKVLFAGTAGLKKSLALNNLRTAIEELYTGERVFTQTRGNAEEQVPVLEDALYGPSPIAFLQLPVETQKAKWRETFQEIRRQFDGAQREHHFLGVHLTFRFQQVPSCIASFADLIDWRPDCIITFIDDAYCVRQRIHNGGYTSFTLAELILWRAEEILVGDLLARVINPERPPPNYVVAVKHPCKMLARLLLSRDRVARIYLSHNITEARKEARFRGTIDRFRQKLRQQTNCSVFEPLAIDEKPPLLRIPRRVRATDILPYNPSKLDDRWPVLNPRAVLSSDADLINQYPLQIPLQELKDVQTAIDSQVRWRDIRLVDQSHYLLVYRPTITGDAHLSTGVHAEVEHAQHTGCPVLWYIKQREDPLPTSPFAPKNPGDNPDLVYEPTETRLWERIAELSAHLDPSRNHFLK